MSKIIEAVLKRVPLHTRLKVPLEMAYLNIIIAPNTCCTNEQFNEAHEWAEELATYLIGRVEDWERDGRPPRTIPSVPPEDREKLHEGKD